MIIIPGILVSIATFPGVIVHEAAQVMGVVDAPLAVGGAGIEVKYLYLVHTSFNRSLSNDFFDIRQ